MNNEKYVKLEDFLNDESFKNWAKGNQLADIEFWDNWIQNNPDKKELANDARDIIVGIQFENKEIDTSIIDEEWNQLESLIKDRNAKTLTTPFYKNIKYLSIAATILLLITLPVVYFANQETPIVHKTAYGEVMDIILPDGSQVNLNSNSSLSYFENTPRKINLKGEAYFKVEKIVSTNAKFWVETNDLKVEVYGTAFNVNNRKENTQVYLEEGNIELKLKNGKEKVMTPGDLISYSYKLNTIKEETNSNGSIQTSWKKGSLTFDRTPLVDALSKIEDTYGVIPIFEDQSCKNILITGAVPTRNLEICLQTIEKSAQVIIINNDNKLYIRKK